MDKKEVKLKGNKIGSIIDADTLWMADPKRYKEVQDHVYSIFEDIKVRPPQIVSIENPVGTDWFHSIDGKPFSSTLLSKAPKQLATEDFDTERAKTDFIYFATHCLIDARTGKPFQGSSAQIELMRRFVEYKKQKQKTLSK